MHDQPKRRANIVTSALPDGYVVLLNEDTNWAHTITPFSALVWEYCDGMHTETQIVEELKLIPELATTGNLAEQVKTVLKKFDEDGFFDEDDAV